LQLHDPSTAAILADELGLRFVATTK